MLHNLHIGALTESIQLCDNTWVSQHANMLLPDRLPVLELELKVIHLTEDAISLRLHKVGPSSGRSSYEENDA